MVLPNEEVLWWGSFAYTKELGNMELSSAWT